MVSTYPFPQLRATNNVHRSNSHGRAAISSASKTDTSLAREKEKKLAFLMHFMQFSAKKQLLQHGGFNNMFL